MAPLPDPLVPGSASDAGEPLKAALDLHRQGRRDEAEQLYRQVLETDPGDAAALCFYGALQMELQRTEEAERLLRRAEALQPANAEVHVALANLARQCGRPADAIERYRKVLSLQPGHPTAVQNLATLLLQRGFADDADFEAGIDVCRAAIAMLPDPAPAQAVLGRILLAAGRTKEAAAAYRAAVTLAPASLAARTGLALALTAAGEGMDALRAADAAVALGPDDPDAWFARGGALMALHQPRTAGQAFERALTLGPPQAKTLLGLGNAYAELDRPEEALAFLSHAAALDPASAAIQASLGSVHYEQGDLDSAEHHLRLALAADPKMAAAHRNLAGVFSDRGEQDLARHHSDTAFRLRNVFIETAADARARVLVLTTSGSGNIPHRFLLPTERYTRIDWFIEYAGPRQAETLPTYDVVFNIIGDPDYADPTTAAVDAFLQRCDRRVLNNPARIGPTRRDRLPGLLAGIEGLLIPKVARFDAGAIAVAGLAASVKAAGLSMPILIRPIGSHGGKGLVVVQTADDLAGIDVAEGAYATEFVDFRGPDACYRKYRMIFIDRRPYPYHLAIANGWLVHYDSAQMPGNAERQAEELRFLDDPRAALGEAAMDAVTALGKRLDLDYAGVDFSILSDGRVLVFEANATMLVHPERSDGEFAHKNPYIERITAAFQDLVDRRAR